MRAWITVVALSVLGAAEDIQVKLTRVIDAEIFSTDFTVIAIIVTCAAAKLLFVDALSRDTTVYGTDV